MGTPQHLSYAIKPLEPSNSAAKEKIISLQAATTRRTQNNHNNKYGGQIRSKKETEHNLDTHLV